MKRGGIQFHNLLSRVGPFLVPILAVAAIATLIFDRPLYLVLTDEDNILEWATVVFLLSSGILSIAIGLRLFQAAGKNRWFFITFGACCILSSLEEISWGQRILGLESTDFFLENSDQKEINAHNVIQKRFNVETKHIAGVTLFIYGVLLPYFMRDFRVRTMVEKVGLVVPPLTLAASFFIAALMTIDWPTGSEEELAELFFSLCFLVFIGLEYLGEQHKVKPVDRGR